MSSIDVEKVNRLAEELSKCSSLELAQVLQRLNEHHNIQKAKCVECRFKKMFERRLK